MRPDDILLLDMLLAAREAVSFLHDATYSELESNRMRQLAVIKSIEVIGEAAAKVSQEYRDTHPELPWRDIINMRHRLVHGYAEVNLNRVWQTVQDDLPPLISSLDLLVLPNEC